MAKVLHIIGNFKEDEGGAQRVILDIINSCHNPNLKMGVCSLFGKATLAKELSGNIFNANFNYAFKYNPKIYFDLYRVIVNWQPDILQIHSSVVGIFARPIASILGIKQITTVHNDVGKAPVRNRLIDKFTIGRSKTVVAVSDIAMESILEEYGNFISQNTDVVKIQNCLNCSSFRDGIKEDSVAQKKELGFNKKKYVIGTVGRLHPVKGQKYLIEAWEDIIESYPQSVLVFVGDGEERNNLEKLANKLSIEQSVYFLGSRNDIPDILNMFDVFVLPSLSEGLPISLLEAMCMEKIIIASDIEPLKQVLDNTGILVPPKDPKSLGEQILEVLNNFEELKQLGSKARKRVLKNFSPEEFGRKYIDVYNKVISE